MAWDPGRFVLLGEFCPTREIGNWLDRFAAEQPADFTLHFAADEKVLLRSLTFATGRNDPLAKVFATLLRTADYVTSRRQLNSAIHANVHMGQQSPAQVLKGEDARMIVGAVDDLLEGDSSDDEVIVARLSSFGADVQSFLLLWNPDGPLDLTVLGDAAHELVTMVNGTAEVNNRRDNRVMSSVGRHLYIGDEHPSAGPDELARYADRAVNLALEVTRSEAAALYRVDPMNPQTLVRIAVTDNTIGLLSRLDAQCDDTTLLGWAVRHNRGVQHPPGPPLRSDYGLSFDAGDEYCEIITPVPGARLDSPNQGSGALVAIRKTPFSAYDHALLRNVSFRLALRLNALSFAEIADAISWLRDPQSDEAATDVSLPPEIAALVPEDSRKALPRIQTALATLCKSTSSHSATFRLALYHGNLNESKGFALIRAVAYPERALMDRDQVQFPGSSGINWAVASSGRFLVLDDVLKDDRYVAVRNSRSELCVPVRLEGRLIGTLNLESPFYDNYAPFLPQVQAFAGAVGRTLADSAASMMEVVLDRAVSKVNILHDLNSDLDKFKDWFAAVEKSLSPDLRGTLADWLSSIEGYVSLLFAGEASAPEPRDRDRSLGNVLGRASKSSGLILPSPSVTKVDLERVIVKADQATMLEEGLTGVLSNIVKHSTKTPRQSAFNLPWRHFAIRELRWSGTSYVSLEFTNEADYEPRSSTINLLYRVPQLDEKGRLRLGAFLSGLKIRRCGGSVHAAIVDGHPYHVKTAVLVPDLRSPC